MAVEATFSKYKKTNFKIGIIVLVGLGIWFGYDGHFNEKFEQKHTDEQGNPDSTMVFNQKAPPYMIGVGILIGVYFLVVKGKKVVADDNGITVGGKTIAYDSIEKVDKTHFESNGDFALTYKDESGQESDLKISNRTYDNLSAVLDEIVAKIS